MQSEGILLAVPSIINPARLGLAKYHIFFQLSTADEEKKQVVINLIANNPCVCYVASTGGKWDVLASVLVTSYDEFEAFLDKVFADNAGIVKDYEAAYIVREEHHALKHIQQSKKNSDEITLKTNENTVIINYADSPSPIDELDCKILSITAPDARIPCLEIGRRVGVSYKTVQARIKRMEQQGIIAGYRPVTDVEMYGFQRFLLLLSFNNYGRLAERKMFAHARSSPAIMSSAKLFGRWSLMLELAVKDHKELQEFVVQMRTAYPIIGSYEVVPVFGRAKLNWLTAITT